MKLVSRPVIGILALAGAMTLGMVTLSRGQGAAPAKPGTKLAVVNLSVLFGDLTEKADATAEIDAMRGDYEKKLRDMKDEVDKLQQNVTRPIIKQDSPDFQKMQDDLLQKSLAFRNYSDFVEQKAQLMQTSRTALIYKKIGDAVAAYAKANDIAMVFVADQMDVTRAQTPEQLTAMVTVRRVLYADPAYDITSAIRQKMNTDYELTRKK